MVKNRKSEKPVKRDSVGSEESNNSAGAVPVVMVSKQQRGEMQAQ